MKREEYKRAKRRWIIQPIAAIVVIVVLCCIAEAVSVVVVG